MTDSLKKKTISGLFWTALDKIGIQVIQLIVGVITARILGPKDFGLIGALSIFILLSNMLVVSGFVSALVRKETVSNEEYSAVFFFNVGISIVLYLILYFCAPLIALFFEMPELTALSRLVFFAIILYSFSIIQIAKLTKEFGFKTLTIANVISFTVSGIVTIWMALNNYSYWAIAWQQILIVGISMLTLWIAHPIKISLKPDFSFIKNSFKFSSTLLISGFINIATANIYNVIIGKIYKVNELGYFSQARKYQLIPTTVFTQILQTVSFPAFSKLNNEKERQITYLRKMVRIAAFLIFPISALLIGLAEPIISIVLSDKWLPSTPYFQLLLVGSIVYTFHVLFIQLFLAEGKLRMYFFLELAKNILILASIPAFIGNINNMLIGFIVANFISYGLDIYFIYRHTSYTPIQHFKDVAPYFVLSFAMCIMIYFGQMLDWNIYIKTLTIGAASTAFYFVSLHLLGSKIFSELLSFIKKDKKEDITLDDIKGEKFEEDTIV